MAMNMGRLVKNYTFGKAFLFSFLAWGNFFPGLMAQAALELNLCRSLMAKVKAC
jgi:uncharacterized membrane protein